MKLSWKPFNVEIQHQCLLLLFSIQTSALKHLSCQGADSFWQTTIGQSSVLCQWLSALLWVWRAVGRRLCNKLDFHTDQSPFTYSLPSRWCHHPCATHTHGHTETHTWNQTSALPLSLSHYLPLFTFLLLLKKQYQTSCSPHWIHTGVNTGPNFCLMLIWHHQESV